MTSLSPQPAAGLRGRDHGNSSAGEITAQPIVFTRLDGEQLRFRSVESFRIWWDVQQQRKTTAKEIAGRA